MSRLVNFFKKLLKRSNESIVIVRSKDGPARVFTKLPTVILDSSRIMVGWPINKEISFTDLGNGEYVHNGKSVTPRQHTEPFVCNGGVNCPWTEELKFPIDDVRFTSREVCLKCGKVGSGSGQ
jgi:hypothetical protein